MKIPIQCPECGLLSTYEQESFDSAIEVQCFQCGGNIKGTWWIEPNEN